MSVLSLKKALLPYVLQFREKILSESPLPAFKEKHLFVARMRILLFIFTWLMFFVFYPEIWSIAPAAPIMFNLGFFTTSICYWNLLHEKYVFPMFMLEAVADVFSQTAIIYIFGLDSAVPYLFYGFYVVGAGSLFGFFPGLVAAIASFISFAFLYFCIKTGVIAEFVYPSNRAGLIHLEGYEDLFNLLFVPFALGFVVYGLKITHHFNQLKQKALERRHIQLTALNNIGSTIRRALNTKDVIQQVLSGVTKGLRFEVCLLALVDEKNNCLRFHVAGESFYARKMQEILGTPFQELELPLNSQKNAITSSIHRKRVVIRNYFIELTHDLTPHLNEYKCTLMQNHLGFKKFVMTPLIAEQKGIGVLIGASTNDYIEDTVIDTLDHFANQAALAIESAQLFETLEKSNIELTRANQVKSDFLAIMSHELRTPLIAVIGYSEILIDKIMGELNQDQMNSVREILRNAKNLLELINSVLDLAKIDSGKMELSLERFDLKEVVDDVQKTMVPLLAKKNQKFELKVLNEKLPLMVGDLIKIRQILINLIGNAIKFTETHGVITVSLGYFSQPETVLKKEFQKENTVNDLLETPAFYIAVRDSGIGIEPKNMRKIFDAFSQVDSSYTRTHEGTGLGLALTKQLVLLHSGMITVSSQQGKGSEFKILLPQKNKTKADEMVA